MKTEVISIVLDNRRSDASSVQDILTSNGCVIQIRLGVHEIQGCSNQGLILVVAHGSEEETDALLKSLKACKSIKVSSMSI